MIRENEKSLKFVNSSPFKSLDSAKSITKGCDIYGPIKASELIKRHSLTIKLKDDFDVFFCDSEGIASLDGFETKSIPGILILLQISTISVYIVHHTINTNYLKNYWKKSNKMYNCNIYFNYIYKRWWGRRRGRWREGWRK